MGNSFGDYWNKELYSHLLFYIFYVNEQANKSVLQISTIICFSRVGCTLWQNLNFRDYKKERIEHSNFIFLEIDLQPGHLKIS